MIFKTRIVIHLYDSIIGCEDTYSSKIDLGIDSSLASQLDMQLSFTNMLCYDSINATVKVLYLVEFIVQPQTGVNLSFITG